METLNTVPSSGVFSSVVDVINENMSLITDAINQVENNTEKFVGLYSSSSSLPSTGVVAGCWAGVLGAGGFPAAIYEYNGSAWNNSGKTWEPDSAATAAVAQAEQEAIAAIDEATEAAIERLDLSYVELT